MLPVAVEGDTRAETSPKLLEIDTGGKGRWELVSFEVRSGKTLKVGVQNVSIRATATWTYAGGMAGNTPIIQGDSATLEARPTRLTDGGQALLLDGMDADGKFPGNQIVVSVSQRLLKTEWVAS